VRFLFLRLLCVAACVAVSVECSVCSVLKGERVEREKDEYKGCFGVCVDGARRL